MALKKSRKRNSRKDGFEEWGGYMNAKISKLEDQFNEEFSVARNEDRVSNIFKGIAIFVNGYTEPSADELRCLMLQHGGIYHHYYRSGKTTHIIASSLPNAKFNQMKSLKVVRCEWITESVKVGKLLDYKKFLLQNNFPGQLKFKRDMFAAQFENDKGAEVYKKEPEVPKTAADDGYIADFYGNSRLHYISELGAMLKQYVQELRKNHNGLFPGKQQLMENPNFISDSITEDTLSDETTIMHIDLDCFFVAVALRNHPHLRGQPVAVTHSKGRPPPRNGDANRKYEANFYKKRMEAKIKGKKYLSESEDEDDNYLKEWSNEVSSMSEIASCSYEARNAGVRKGMYLGAALKLCPNLKTVPYDFEGYREVSLTLYNTIAEYTLDLEAISCDEMFIDCGSLLKDLKIHPLKLSEILRRQIEEKTKCSSSVGIGSNKLQARLATKRAKPNGQFHLTSDRVEEFMKDLDVGDLPGVGRTLNGRLKTLNIKTCHDLQRLPLVTLRKEFGVKTGEMLYKYCRGIDDRKVKYSHERKSVSAEVNYGIRFNDDEEAEKFLRELSAEVSKRLQAVKMMGKAITFKVMYRAKDAPKETAKFLGHGVCDMVNRSTTITATNDTNIIAKHVIGLFHQLGIPANELRGIGIQITKLECMKNSKTLQAYFGGEQKPKEPAQVQVKKDPPIEPLPVQVKNTPAEPLPTASQIDLEVLNSLPEDIRLEVMREYGLTDLDKNKNKDYKNSNSKHSEIPPTLSPSYSSGDPKTDEATKKLLTLSLKEMRLMIKEWVAAEHYPQPWDVCMLKSYLSSLVYNKQLENLSILLRCIYRHIVTRKRNYETWKTTYNELEDAVQTSMYTIYGKALACERF